MVQRADYYTGPYRLWTLPGLVEGPEYQFELFDFDFNAAVIPSQRIRVLATGRFIEEHRNLVLSGPPGIGKTPIAQALGHEAARRGWEMARIRAGFAPPVPTPL